MSPEEPASKRMEPALRRPWRRGTEAHGARVSGPMEQTIFENNRFYENFTLNIYKYRSLPHLTLSRVLITFHMNSAWLSPEDESEFLYLYL